jgi:formylmethanofuran dehydrogenase subunit E
MTAHDIMKSEAFKKCQVFHGHICPGLAIGYRAAAAGMAWLQEKRSADEEIVAIVETDACMVDAVQVITGCTFGKGNFIYKDHGKLAFSLLSRHTGRGVRIAFKGETGRPDEEHMALIRKKISGEISDKEEERFQHLHFKRSCLILEAPLEDLFTTIETSMQLPGKANIEPSIACSECGEPVMRSKMEKVGERLLCRGCIEEIGC